MYACICYAVTESEVCDAAARHDAQGDVVDHVSHVTGAGTGCGTCVDRLCDLVGGVVDSVVALGVPARAA